MRASNMRRFASLFSVAALGVGVIMASSAQAAWPERNVTMFVHSGSGSSSDVMARTFAKALESVTDVKVIVQVKGRDYAPA